MTKKTIVWFSEVGKDDVALVGGKGANLGEMVNAGFPIPYGFIITAQAYFDFINKNNLSYKINSIIKTINYEDPSQLHLASKNIRELIDKTQFPKELELKIIYYYDQLLEKEEELIKKNKLSLFKKINVRLKSLYRQPYLAVRSSATAEDLPSASFAGQQETYLNVKGEAELIKKIKFCWSSLFTERAIYYRHQQGFDHNQVGLAVVCQRMIQAEKSGIAFSIDPINNDKNKIVIEAIYGLGEYIVSGKVTPDHYEISKDSLIILNKQIKTQKIGLRRYLKSNKEFYIPSIKGKQQKLTDQEIIKLALLIKDIEKHYYFPQDIEWAIEKNQIFIVQSRPITTIKTLEKKEKENLLEIDSSNKVFLTGSPASPGMVTGPVKIIYSPKEINQIKKGDILVAPQTNPDYVPAMKKAAAIITEKGGRTSHAAIVSRELGIPAIVGVEKATKLLKNDQIVTVNGLKGEIYLGTINFERKKLTNIETSGKKSITKIYVNLAEPEIASQIAKKNVDGVGLLRAEFMIANIGVHPKSLIHQKKEALFVHQLTKDLVKFVKPFAPRPVIYRATDFKTNEYRHLRGGENYEPLEENPMLGFRGASRYIKNPDVFLLELKAIANIWQMGYHNLHLMIPFLRAPWELIKIKEIINKTGLFNNPLFQLFIMVEVPSAAFQLEEFLKIGVDGVSIGTNDLTMLLLGVDRDNAEVADIYDERSPAVLSTLEQIVETANKFNVKSSICGQAASDYPEIIERLIKKGITSLSVNPDAIDRTRDLVFDLEKKIYR